jgi:hypothetical protein
LEVADEVATFQFHPTQTIMREPNRSTVARFRAGGVRDADSDAFRPGIPI